MTDGTDQFHKVAEDEDHLKSSIDMVDKLVNNGIQIIIELLLVMLLASLLF